MGPGELAWPVPDATETVYGPDVSGGGLVVVSSGGILSGVASGTGTIEVLSGAIVADSGGLVLEGTTLLLGSGFSLRGGPGSSIFGLRGTIAVDAGASVSGTTLSSYGIQTVSSGGVASGTVVSRAGFQEVSSSGTTVGVMVLGGGFQDVGGGTASGTIIEGGGNATQFVDAHA